MTAGRSPGAFETHAFPTPALQNQQLTLRGAGSLGRGSTLGQPRDKVARCRSSCEPAEPHRGPIQAREVGNTGARVRTGINVPNVGFFAVPFDALVPACLRSASSSPARSAWLRHGSGMAGLRRRRRRGTRTGAPRAALPETLLVKGLALAQHVVHRPPQPGRQDGQRLAFAALGRLLLLPLL